MGTLQPETPTQRTLPLQLPLRVDKSHAAGKSSWPFWQSLHHSRHAPLLRRYIWLPLWVVDIPQAVESPLRGAVHAQQRSIKRNKFRSMRPGPTNMQSLPPVDVVVRYATHLQLPLLYEAWRTHVGGYACVALLWLGPSQAHGQASSTAGIAWCWGSVGPWGS